MRGASRPGQAGSSNRARHATAAAHCACSCCPFPPCSLLQSICVSTHRCPLAFSRWGGTSGPAAFFLEHDPSRTAGHLSATAQAVWASLGAAMRASQCAPSTSMAEKPPGLLLKTANIANLGSVRSRSARLLTRVPAQHRWSTAVVHRRAVGLRQMRRASASKSPSANDRLSTA